MKIAHIITRLILGGAQENTVYSCIDLARRHGATVRLFTGPTTGPEGSLVKYAKDQGVDLVEIPSLIRAINPLYDVGAYFQIRRELKEFAPDVVHTHSAKAGILGRAAAHSLRIPLIVHTFITRSVFDAAVPVPSHIDLNSMRPCGDGSACRLIHKQLFPSRSDRRLMDQARNRYRNTSAAEM